MPSISVIVVFSSECSSIELPSSVAAPRSCASFSTGTDFYVSLSYASFKASADAVPIISNCQSNELGRDLPFKVVAVACILNV